MMFKLEREIGDKVLSIETGRLARQAHGSVVVKYGDTVVLGACVTAPPREGIDFFPLTVDYREKLSAAGKFPGGFFKREGRPTTKEILTMRMIDRPLRPNFPKGYMDEVQVQVWVLSADLENEPDVVGMVAGAASVMISGAPFQGPLAAVRVGRVDGEFVINPTHSQIKESDIDLIVAGNLDNINMIEVGSKEISEETLYDAIEFGHEHGVIPINEMLIELQKRAGKPVTWKPTVDHSALHEEIRTKFWDDMVAAKSINAKQERGDAVSALGEKILATYCPPDVEEPEHDSNAVKGGIRALEKAVIRERILHKGQRSDGRKLDELREINCEVGWLPRNHGSAIFGRGETQAIVSTTLGTASDEQLIDELMEEYKKSFMLHYNFPPFSVGEARRIGPPGRREIGHGALAERSLEAVLPDPDSFPYTIRLVSDILESNGSSSMASVCGGTLALMDAGVPIKAPVAGISIGLVEDDDKYVLLTDILGEEDGFGDMDFKVAGTRKGITGVQLDIKSGGLKFKILKEALKRAREVRLQILDIMAKTIAEPRPEISNYAPRLITMKIDPEKIGKVIGPGGKQIRAIQAETGARVDIEDDGTIYIASTDPAGALRAQEIIAGMTEDVEVGRIYNGKVISIKDFGAFIELREGQDGLCHISELSDGFVKSVTDVVKMGDMLKVKVIAIDDQGRVKLSRKAVIKEEAAAANE